MKVLIHIDGGSRGNPGPAACGVVICNTKTQEALLEAGYYLGEATNNVAEYSGLIHALEDAKQLGASELEIISDSQLMVRQVMGQYRVKSPDLKPLHQKVIASLGGFEHWKIKDVRRAENKRADQLVNQCLDLQEDVVVTWQKPSA